ncbi:MAG: segregation/condensation protein A [Firmicutes bacterium]|uniref:Segregation and condensation protein A n=1 Tax=Candidatus Stercoripulliclostridium pullicola TaxID=2840953 RepID=A0A940DFH3_9FIRM|nr:segregation/condensation protein A [Candidatus Stercoripulliclostridium pullicola]
MDDLSVLDQIPEIGQDDKFSFTSLSYHLYEEDVALDKLLDILKKDKVAIRDIFISSITEQYLAYVVNLTKEEKDYDDISSFLVLAATLIELKAASLLPKPEFEEYEDDGLSDEELFYLRAEEYAAYRDAAEKLRSYEILNRYYREPVFGEDDYKVVIKDFSLQKMIEAFSRMLERAEFEEDHTAEKTIEKERFSVSDRMVDVVEALRALSLIKLNDLFEPGFTKLEIINTFLAVLEIVKQQIAAISVEGDPGEIIVRHLPDTDKFNYEEDLIKDADEYN